MVPPRKDLPSPFLTCRHSIQTNASVSRLSSPQHPPSPAQVDLLNALFSMLGVLAEPSRSVDLTYSGNAASAASTAAGLEPTVDIIVMDTWVHRIMRMGMRMAIQSKGRCHGSEGGSVGPLPKYLYRGGNHRSRLAACFSVGVRSSKSAAGNGLTNIMENHTFVPRARYLRLLRRRRRYELLYHSELRLCSEFCESRSFLWLNI